MLKISAFFLSSLRRGELKSSLPTLTTLCLPPSPWSLVPGLLFATVDNLCSQDLLMTMHSAVPTGKLRQNDPKQNCIKSIWERNTIFGLPWWSSSHKSAWQCSGHALDPWSRKIPHSAKQLSSCTTTTAPMHLEPMLCNRRSHGSERPADCNRPALAGR